MPMELELATYTFSAVILSVLECRKVSISEDESDHSFDNL